MTPFRRTLKANKQITTTKTTKIVQWVYSEAEKSAIVAIVNGALRKCGSMYVNKKKSILPTAFRPSGVVLNV